MKAFFLDRDGVVNESHSVNTYNEFHLISGVPEAIKKLNDYGYHVFIVTNQNEFGLGYMKERQLTEIHETMKILIGERGGVITDIRACIHKPKAGCLCRKPKPGMLRDLIKTYSVDTDTSFMVGDRDVDIQAGKSAGVQTVFVGPGNAGDTSPTYQFATLAIAVEQLEQQGVLGRIQ